MTFSGCFTCRSRGVKCDEQKPLCQRCVKAGRECAGYGVRLVWAGQESQENPDPNKAPSVGLRSLRRSLPWAYGAESGAPAGTPALSDDVLDEIIAALPSEQGAAAHVDYPASAVTHEHPHAYLFGVFAAALPSSPACIPSPVLQACLDDLDMSLDPILFSSMDCPDNTDIVDAIVSIALQPSMMPSAVPTPYAAAHSSYTEHHSAPMTWLCPSPQPSKESQLLDYWATHTSNIMISIPRSDNPYRTIYIPMALAAQSQLVPSPEHTALLHSIFSLAAFNHAQKQPLLSRSAFSRLGVDHHRRSISSLLRSLAPGHKQPQNPDVVLATIILLASTSCVTCSSTSWRTHLRLGRQWLASRAQTRWHTEPAASTLYQIFLMLEALGTTAEDNVRGLPAAAGALATGDSAALAPGHGAPDYTYSSVFGLSCPAVSYDYRLDSLFGIAQPIFEAVVHINRLGALPGPLAHQEVDNLRAKIMLNDPRALRRSDAFARAGETERRLIHHHAYVYYFACRIHYERTLFHVAPHAIQHLVRSALDHLDAIAHLGSSLDVVGLTWPVLVVASEVDDPHLEKRVAWFFEQGQRHGVGGISSAYQVLTEVWRRRRVQPRDFHAHVRWQNVMAELGMDLLLA